MGITDAWLKANHKKLKTKKLIKTDRDGLNAREHLTVVNHHLWELSSYP